jgi:hypothetical protein
VTFYVPAAAATDTLPGSIAGNIVVQTEEAKREEQRWQTIATFKLPRHAEGHWACLYANHWLRQRANTTSEALFDAWLRLAQEFIALHDVALKYQDRYSKTVETIRCWFLMLPSANEVPIEKVPGAYVKLFQAQVELFLELYLLNTPQVGGAEQATRAFWTSVASVYHNTGQGFDYYKAVTEARTTKHGRSEPDSAKNAHRGPASFSR